MTVLRSTEAEQPATPLLLARRIFPGLLVVIIGALAALLYGVGPWDLLKFSGASLWSVLLPGHLVLRWCRPRARTLVEDLSVSFVVGIAVQLLAWAAFVGAGVGSWLALYPAILLVAAAAIPRLRVGLRRDSYPEQTPPGAAWALSIAYAVTVLTLALGTFAGTALPPGRARWVRDLYWHLAISAQARTNAPPQVPQVAGQELKYHWFANAHMAADSLVGHLGVLVVTARLWYLPFYAVIIGLTYVVTTRLSRSSAAGVLAVTMLTASAAFLPLHWTRGVGTGAFFALSPSLIFGLPPLLLVTWWVVEMLRGQRASRPSWALLLLLLLVCAGAKSSNLPVLLCAVLLVVLVAAARRRLDRRALLVAAMTLFSLAVTAPFLAGGGSGSKIKILAAAEFIRTHQVTLTQLPQSRAVWVVLLLSLAIVLQFAGLLFAVPLLRDPGALLLLGMVLAALAAVFLVDHPSLSEVYFLSGVLPEIYALQAWGFVDLLRRTGRSWRTPTGLRHLVLAATAGGLLVFLMRWIGGSGIMRDATLIRAWLVVIVIVAGLVVLTLLWSGGLTRGSRRGSTTAVGTAAALAAAALLGATVLPSSLVRIRSIVDARPVTDSGSLTAAQIAGTTWIREQVAPDQLIATNVHCFKGPTVPECDSRAFWVTGLSEHQAYVSSWAYTDQAQATATQPLPRGVRRLYYARQPFWDQARLRRNDIAFRAPTPQRLDTLYRAGVRVLFADSGAGPVSPHLNQLTDRVFRRGAVSVFRLRPPQ